MGALIEELPDGMVIRGLGQGGENGRLKAAGKAQSHGDHRVPMSLHVDKNWESPYLARFLKGLGKVARVIHTDHRGWGCSDRFSPGDVAPLEVQVDDLVAVMDVAGSERAVIFAAVDTAPSAILFAASNAERTAGLVLVRPTVVFYRDEAERQEWAEVNDLARKTWGTPAWDHFGPTWDEREFLDWFVPWCRASVALGALAAESDAFGDVDVRDVLPSIHVPTLVVGPDEPDDPDDKPSRNAQTSSQFCALLTLY